MSEPVNKGGKTVCDMVTMAEAYMSLTEIITSLSNAYEKAEGLAASFSESYEGTATEEVMMFLENLPLHIYRLTLFYGKMSQFLIMTLTSFLVNDETMAENMENQ